MENIPPDGFVPWDRGGSPVTRPWEPIYSRTAESRIEIGTFIREAHFNSRGFLHGGVLAALCDVAMGYACGLVLRAQGIPVSGLLTTHLSLDYIGKADSGWLQIDPKVIHAGRNSSVTEATAFADGRIVAHAKASFRSAPTRSEGAER